MRFLFAFALMAGTALAGETLEQGQDIPVEEWREMALGKNPHLQDRPRVLRPRALCHKR